MNTITKTMVKRGYEQNLIKLITDPNMEAGVVCQIWDNWFYFGGMTAEEMTVEEYKKDIPEDTIIDEIYNALNELKTEFADEYLLYFSILNNYLSSTMKISELIKKLNDTMRINGDMNVAICVDGKIYTEIELNCPDSDSPLYIEGYTKDKT